MERSTISAPSITGSYSHLASWNVLKQLTGERISYRVNDETNLDELNASFIRDHNTPDPEPLSLILVIEAALPREKLDDASWVGSTPRSPVPPTLE